MNRLLDDFTKAIVRNDSTFVQTALSNGSVDANAIVTSSFDFSNEEGCEMPALVLAAQLGCAEIAEILLNAGARIDDVDDRNRSACMYAAADETDDVLRVLLAHKPNLELRSAAGTALKIAVHYERDESIVLALIEAGA
jgi:ankyrin repeat protein